MSSESSVGVLRRASSPHSSKQIITGIGTWANYKPINAGTWLTNPAVAGKKCPKASAITGVTPSYTVIAGNKTQAQVGVVT